MSLILGILDSGVTGGGGGGVSYESIATVTLTSTASTVTFSSIPQTYTHLQLRVLSAQGNVVQAARLWANSDTITTNYWTHYLAGNGSIKYSTASNENYALWDSGTTSGFYATVIDILDYTNTNKKKTIRSLQGYDLNGSGAVGLLSMLWNNTAAITSLQFADNGSAFQSGGSYALYGIKGA
jgi:hypothetical protein